MAFSKCVVGNSIVSYSIASSHRSPAPQLQRYFSEKIFIKYLFTFFALFITTVSLAIFADAKQGRIENEIEMQYVITKQGLPGVIEIGMELNDLQSKGLVCEEMVFISEDFEEEYGYHEEFGITYKIDSLGVEFQIKNTKIIRIWFFEDRNPLLKIFLPKDDELKSLYEISALDIIRNYGPVKKYLNETPSQKKEPQWAKYSPLGVFTNQISYPGCPFFFGLTEDDNLIYITVSNLEQNKAN